MVQRISELMLKRIEIISQVLNIVAEQKAFL